MSQSLQLQYNKYQEVLETLQNKVTQLDGDISEHKVVLDTLKTLPKDRRCWRMVDSSLVETNCADASTTLQGQLEGMQNASKQLVTEVQGTQKEFTDWKKKNNVKIVRPQQS